MANGTTNLQARPQPFECHFPVQNRVGNLTLWEVYKRSFGVMPVTTTLLWSDGERKPDRKCRAFAVLAFNRQVAAKKVGQSLR